MLLLRIFVVLSCVLLTLAVKIPPRALYIQGASLVPMETYEGRIGQAKAKIEDNRSFAMKPPFTQSDPEIISEPIHVAPTTYAPRPTTSMPQSQLRALCITPRGKFPHPLDCRKYVDCWDGRVLEKRCPNDLVFSDLPGEFCDYLEYVDCGTRPVLADTIESIEVVTTTAAPVVSGGSVEQPEFFPGGFYLRS